MKFYRLLKHLLPEFLNMTTAERYKLLNIEHNRYIKIGYDGLNVLISLHNLDYDNIKNIKNVIEYSTESLNYFI